MTEENSRFERIPIPEETLPERVATFGEILHSYLPDGAVLEAQRCLQCEMPWCVQACPIAQDCRGYILQIAERKFDEAAVVTLRENPLALTLCKVCYHYCEEACVLKDRGLPIAIRQLKRSALELGNAERFYVPAASRNQRIAIVGSGPAGLMAAWELCLRGYSVTVFEREPYLGGQVAAIPKYRLEGDEVEIDVARFRDFDCAFVMGKQIGVDFTPESLLANGYRAVYVAIGASTHKTAGVPGESLPGVFPALETLEAINKGPGVPLGQHVVVIGGGDVAMDAVRSSLRLTPGQKVTLIYHRAKEKMSAGPDEVKEAVEEGVQFLFGLAPMRVLGTSHVVGIVVAQEQLGPSGPSGRPTVVAVLGSEQTIPCDTVIMAVGEKADLTGFPPELDLTYGKQGWPEGKQPDTMTGVAGIFASGGKSVVYAMAAGTRTAEAIDAYLSKKDGVAPTPRPDPFGTGNPPRLPKGYAGPTWTP